MARIFARRRPPRTVTAAVQPVRDPAKAFRATLGTGRDGGHWSATAWQMYEQCGELRYICTWKQGALSRCLLVASEIDQKTGRPTGTTTNARVRDIVRDIAGGPTGQKQLVGRLGVFLTVPGEGYVAVIVRGEGRDETEEWHLLDRAEITTKGTEIVLALADGTKHTYDKERGDVLFRVWNPHPRISTDADSPVRSVLPAFLEIVQATTAIRHAAKSRLIGGKILMLPSQLSLPMSQSAPRAAPVDPDAPTLPPPPPAAVDQGSAQDVQDMLFDVAEAAAKDPDSGAAHLPIVITADGEHIKNATLIDLHSDINKEQLEIRAAAIRRVALGMDIPAEVLLGISEMNHWNAWAMQDDAIQVHIVPLLETIADALTTALLRPTIERINREEGLDIDPDDYVVWFDTTALTEDPDKAPEARDAFDRGALTAAALRKYSGFDDADGYDLTTAEGIQQFARDQVARDPSLLPQLAPYLGADLPAPAPDPAAPAAREIEAPAAREQAPEEPDEVTSAAEPARAVASLLLMRALELAGKRRQSRAATVVAGVPAWELHTHMPPADRADVPRLISGWDAGLTPEVAAQVGADLERLRQLVVTRATIALTTGRRASIGAEIRTVLR